MYTAIISMVIMFFTVFFSTNCSATHITNKTFLASRPAASYLPYEIDLWSHINKHRYNISLTPIYTQSTNKNALSHYFMYQCKSCLNIGKKNDPNDCISIDHRHFKFDETDKEKFTAQLSFKPQVTNTQIWITYHQNFGRDGTGLFLNVTLPIIHSEYDLGECFGQQTMSSDCSTRVCNFFCGQQMITGSRGCGSEQTMIALQEPLQWGKICGKREKNSIADIYIGIGYTPWRSQTFSISPRLEVIFPTNRTSRAREIFEPRVGHGGHWVLGLRVDMKARAWQSISHNNHALDISGHLRWHYLFSATERRILGLRSHHKSTLNWGHYHLLGHLELPLVLPAANVLAQAVSVRPRHQAELMATCQYIYKNFMITAGYDAWIKGRERLCPQQPWCNNRYAFPGSDFAPQLVTFGHDACPLNEDSPDLPEPLFQCSSANNTNTICSINPSDNGCTIKSSQLDLGPATSPATATHMFFATISYSWQWGKDEILTALGSGYEYASNNAALSQYSLWGSISLQF